MTYNIILKRKNWGHFGILLTTTEEEKDKLADSLRKLRRHIDFPRPVIEEVNTEVVGAPYEKAREDLAKVIGCSELPE